MGNISNFIQRKVGVNLHNRKMHPLEIVKQQIYAYFGDEFRRLDDLSPVVTTKQNFDDLLVPRNHVSRRPTDTYYVDEDHVLRTYMTAHLCEVVKEGCSRALLTGDVYRKEYIDRTHFPIFHQMDALAINDTGDPVDELEHLMDGLMRHLFGGRAFQKRPAFYPFTEPSFEYSVFYNDRWLEVLGCGQIQQQIMVNCGMPLHTGWAFGIGLERLAMALFEIPDIRYFWSNDGRFIDQFNEGKVARFEPWANHGTNERTVTFRLSNKFNERDWFEILRNIAHDYIESVHYTNGFRDEDDLYVTYNITYRHIDRPLMTNDTDAIHQTVCDSLIRHMEVKVK